jgi:hypothetical protein
MAGEYGSALPSPTEWWPNWQPTPVNDRPRDPDVWRRRFTAHIGDGIRNYELADEDKNTARGFKRDLQEAFVTYKTSADADKERQFLLQINAIAIQAYEFYAGFERPNRERVVEHIRFDLAGLAEVLDEVQ